MFPRVGGAVLALVAAALLAFATVVPWWSGHPDVDGHAMRLKSLDVSTLTGAESCNTGGDGKCTNISLTSAFAIVGRGVAGVDGVVAIMLVVLAVATLRRKESRKVIAKLVFAAVGLAGLVGLVAIVLGPGIKAPGHTLSVPIGLGLAMFGVGVVAAVGAAALARKDLPIPVPRPVVTATAMNSGIDALIKSLPPAPTPAIAQAFDIQALIASDPPRPAVQSPGGALAGPSGPLAPLMAPPPPPPPPPRMPAPPTKPPLPPPPARPKLPSVPPPFDVLAKPAIPLPPSALARAASPPPAAAPAKGFVFARSQPNDVTASDDDAKTRERERMTRDELEQVTMRDARAAKAAAKAVEATAHAEHETTTEAEPLQPTGEHVRDDHTSPSVTVPTPEDPAAESTIQTQAVPGSGEGTPGPVIDPPSTPAGPFDPPKIPITTASASLPPPAAATAPASGPSPACPQCEAPMAWVDEHLRFYCKSCRMYF